jgi:hypothetical protein
VIGLILKISPIESGLILSKDKLRKDKLMSGFILNIRKAKNEDIIVTVLSKVCYIL